MNQSSTQPITSHQHTDIPEQSPRRTASETPYFAFVFFAALLVIATVAATSLAAGY